jgi:hypothetical protein
VLETGPLDSSVVMIFSVERDPVRMEESRESEDLVYERNLQYPMGLLGRELCGGWISKEVGQTHVQGH